MDPKLVILLARAGSSFVRIIASGEAGELRAEIEAMIEVFRTRLGEKPGGGAWTDDDLHVAADEARLPWQDVLDTANTELGKPPS